ncbi:MAG TPA: hypothetical protein VFE79_13185 [Paraburkholderia sp.]|nr:hypothetical protein [Paraburkholderia sp.]
MDKTYNAVQIAPAAKQSGMKLVRAAVIASAASAVLGLFAPVAHAAMANDPSATAFRTTSPNDLPGCTANNGAGCVYTYKNADGGWPSIVTLGARGINDSVATLSMINSVPSYTVVPGQGQGSGTWTYPAVDCATVSICVNSLTQSR